MRLAETYRGARRNALRALHRIREWSSIAGPRYLLDIAERPVHSESVGWPRWADRLRGRKAGTLERPGTF